MSPSFPTSVEQFAAVGGHCMPGHLGIEVTGIAPERIALSMAVTPQLLNPVGALHGGAVVALADTACGYGTVVNMPEGGKSFTTIELKTNFLGSVVDGTLVCVATPLHLGRTTQVWDADVTHQESGRRVAMFRCTNLVIRQS
jgi:1,4-dihydroxy-2-naphthoyl-CoA hydrolase